MTKSTRVLITKDPMYKRRSITLAVLKERLTALFGTAFEYPFIDTEFKDLNSMITLRCPIHGDQQKRVNNLLYAQSGCRACGMLRQIISFHLNDEMKAWEEMLALYEYVRDPRSELGNVVHRFGRKPHYQNLDKLYRRFLLKRGPADYLNP